MLRRASVVLMIVIGFSTALANPAAAQGEVTCDDFASNDEGQAKAQSVLNLDPSDPFDLDSDGDGVACDVLPDEGPDGTDDSEYGYGDTAIPVSCADFPVNEEGQTTAQAIYDLDPSDPFRLDLSGDGVACDSEPTEGPPSAPDESGDTADDTETSAAESGDTGTVDDDASGSDASETTTLPNTGTGTAIVETGHAWVAVGFVLSALLLICGGWFATRMRMN